MSGTVKINFADVEDTAKSLKAKADQLVNDLKAARTAASPLDKVWGSSDSGSEFYTSLSVMEKEASEIADLVANFGIQLGAAGDRQAMEEAQRVAQFRKLA